MKPGTLIRWILALSCVTTTWGCAASSIRGTLHVPPEATPLPDPSQSANGARAPAVHGAAEAVVYLEKVPVKLEKRLAREAETRARKQGGPIISQARHRFTPRTLPVAVGTTVEFGNQDHVYHNVFSVSPAMRFDLGKYGPGRTGQMTFDKPGMVRLFCDIDPAMAGNVLVLPHHGFTRPDSTGAFEFPRLPRGTYTIKVWHPTFGTLRRRVEMPKRGDAIVSLSF